MIKKVMLLGATALVLTGCGGANDFAPSAGMNGAEIYHEACASCHGDRGQGKFLGLLKVAGSDHPLSEAADKIRDGGPVMPSFPNIGDADRMAVAEYLKAQ